MTAVFVLMTAGAPWWAWLAVGWLAGAALVLIFVHGGTSKPTPRATPRTSDYRLPSPDDRRVYEHIRIDPDLAQDR